MSSSTCIRQRDASDCGPSCIASVAGHYGKRIPVSRIRQEARTDHSGTSMLGMIRSLEKLNFEARGLKGSADNLHKLPSPFIAHLVQSSGLHHYVCVYRVGKRFLRIMDPATGKRYRDIILAKGGTVDPLELVKEFLQREPNQDAFLRSLGLTETN